MGTRNLTCVVKGGEYKVAQYGQWDGYPEGQGFTIVDFLGGVESGAVDVERVNDLREAVDKCRFVDQKELERRWESDNELFTRDNGAAILSIIVERAKEGKDIPLRNRVDFAGHSLFCEWAYVINLDTNELEVYKGFNKVPVDPSERFANAPTDGDGYHPVRHVVTLPFEKAVSLERDDLIRAMCGYVPGDEEEEE